MGRLQLRPFEREHLPLVEPCFADAATQRWLGGPAWPRQMPGRPLGEFRGAAESGQHRWFAWDRDTAVGHIDCGTYDRWATWEGEPGGGGVTGTIDVPAGSISYVADPALRRRGYGAAMVSAVLAVPELEHIELFASAGPAGAGSAGCLRRPGFEPLNPEQDWEGIVYYSRFQPPQNATRTTAARTAAALMRDAEMRAAGPGRLDPALAGRCPWRSLAVRLAVLVIPPLIGCGGSAVNGSTEGGSSQLTVSSPDSQGRHSRTSSPATAPAGAPTCSGAAATRTRELAIEMLDPTRRVAASPTGWSTGSRPRLQPGGCADGAAEGVNDFGRPGYGGPRPPRGAAHHCHFVALALDTRLGLAAGAKEVRAGVTHHRSRARQGELVATYQRA